MSEIIDGHGNSIRFDGRKLWLKLKDRKESRNIGWFEGGVFHTLRNSTQKFGTVGERGFGFNWHLFKEAKFKVVVVHHDRKVYWATVQEILDGGKCINYSKQGFELQVVYPLDRFKIYDGTRPQAEAVRVVRQDEAGVREPEHAEAAQEGA